MSQARYSTKEKLVLIVVIATSALMAIDMLIVTVALPQIGIDLSGATIGGLQWVVVGYALAFGALIQPAGALSDRLGSRPMYLIGVGGFTIASLACALAQDINFLIAFRVLKGAAAAIMFANSMPLLAKTFDEQRRAMAIALWTGVVGIASLASPILGGLLIDVAGWRSLFFINVPLGVIALVISFIVLKSETLPRTQGRFDFLGACLLAVSLVSLNYGLTKAQTEGFGNVSVLIPLGAFVILVVVFIARSLRIAAPVLDLSLFQNRNFSGVALLAMFNRVGTAGATVYVMIYIQTGKGLTATQTGLLLIPLGVAAFAGSIFAGKRQATFGARNMLALGFGLLGLSSMILGWQLSETFSPWWLIPTMMIWGFGTGCANTPMMNVATTTVDIKKVGMATGVINSFYPIGASLGTLLLGLIFTPRVQGFATVEILGNAVGLVYYAVAVVMLLGVIISLIFIDSSVGKQDVQPEPSQQFS